MQVVQMHKPASQLQKASSLDEFIGRIHGSLFGSCAAWTEIARPAVGREWGRLIGKFTISSLWRMLRGFALHPYSESIYIMHSPQICNTRWGFYLPISFVVVLVILFLENSHP
jgi:hypothetical protein